MASEHSRTDASLVRVSTTDPTAFSELYVRHVTQAHLGCDFDFVRPGHDVPEPYID